MSQDTPQGTQAAPRAPRRTLVGSVVSTKMKNVVTVQVERTYKHAKYGKYLRKRKRYHARTVEGAAPRMGDTVEIMSTRPLSKLVRWRVVRVVHAAVERGVSVAELGGGA